VHIQTLSSPDTLVHQPHLPDRLLGINLQFRRSGRTFKEITYHFERSRTMADVRSLLRSEQASRRTTHPNLSYTKSGLLNCLVCNLIIKAESLWEGHLRSANHKKNLQKAQNGELQDINGTASKKRKMSDEEEDVRKKRKSTGAEQDDVQRGGTQGASKEQDLPADNEQNVVAGPTIPENESRSSAPQPLLSENPVAIHPQIDEDEWAAFEREVVPLAHQNPPPNPINYTSATISAAPVPAAELAAQTNAERQQRRDADADDEKAEEESRLVEEFEVMEGLEERVKRLREKREALRMGVRVTESGGAIESGLGVVEAEAQEKPPEPDEEEDDSDEVDEWGFA
jgi:zinc finger protein 830